MTKKPSVTLRCVADRHAGPTERIVEFSFPGQAGIGGLISLRMVGGVPTIEVYRTDGQVRVLGPTAQPAPLVSVAGEDY